MIESDSDSDSNTDSDLDTKPPINTLANILNSNSNSNDDDDSESEKDDEEYKEKKKAEKKPKLTFQESLDEVTKILEEQSIRDKQHLETLANIIKEAKEKQANNKMLKKLVSSLSAINQTEFKKELAKKKKKNTGGFTAFVVPENNIVYSFLNLESEEEVKMTKPKIYSALHTKFKEMGLQNSNDKRFTHLPENVCKQLNVSHETIKRLSLDETIVKQLGYSIDGKSLTLGFKNWMPFVEALFPKS